MRAFRVHATPQGLAHGQDRGQHTRREAQGTRRRSGTPTWHAPPTREALAADVSPKKLRSEPENSGKRKLASADQSHHPKLLRGGSELEGMTSRVYMPL